MSRNYTRMTGGQHSWYEEYTTTNAYVERPFGSLMTTITVSNDSNTDDVQVSFDGATLAGELKHNETLTLYVHTYNSIYVKGTAGGGNIRIWGW